MMSATAVTKSVLVVTVLALCSPAVVAAAEDAKTRLPLSADEIDAKRKAIREEMMLPSLSGIRSISYRVVGYKSFEPLENLMGNKLGELSIKKSPLVKIKDGTQPFDAIVQISFSKAANNTIAELKVTQWVSLLRNPNIKVRAVTYSNKLYLPNDKPEQAVEQLTNDFVIDFLKSNQKTHAAEKRTSLKQ